VPNVPPSLLSKLTPAWVADFDVFTALDSSSASIRARQLNAVVRLAPFTLGANLFNGVIAFEVLRERVQLGPLVAWFTALLLIVTVGLHGWWRQHRHPRTSSSPRSVRKAVVHSAVLSVVWSTLPLIWYPRGQPIEREIIVMITTGMLGGGAIALSPIPLASMVFVSILASSSILSLFLGGGSTALLGTGLVVIFSVTMVASAVSSGRNSIRRLVTERESEQQSNVISLLLRDFEEHSADVLWETDRQGVFSHVSPKLASMLGHEPARLQRMNLLQIIERRLPSDGSVSSVNSLRSAMQSGVPFRDLIVPVDTNGTTHWWSLTAKPLLDEQMQQVGWRGVIGDVSERQAAQERLEFLAHYDALTGLANRRQLRERLQRVLDGKSDVRHRPASDGPSALLFLDIDHFKTINDTLGHAAGDSVLQLIADRLRTCSRIDDFIVRLGGDEFAMVVDSTAGESEVTAMAERLLLSLREPTDIGGHSIVINASIGVALIPAHGRTVDEVLGNADLALYAAKEAGRAQCRFFAPQLGERSRRRQAVEHELSNALARAELTLHWQPQYVTGTTTIRGVETLLRWNNPRLGDVHPAEFIPIAEDAALVDDIGRWVLIEACALASHHLGDLSISVNVSPRQLRRDAFVEEVKEALMLGGLPAERLEIEITESLFLDDVPTALRHLHELRALGVRIALDDFGTGYSSLGYLRRFPFDTLKIDRAFVRELTHRGDAQAIVRMIIELSATLGMETVAECVEEPEQLMMLQAAGCFAVQGNLLARPMTLTALREMLDEQTIEAFTRGE
jgi:diguanylate cyclase (GGDEF)-like protein/PAS domain S-box-containing protein